MLSRGNGIRRVSGRQLQGSGAITTSKIGEVLYCHGRGGRPADAPGDRVQAVAWPLPLHAPLMDPSWYRRSLSHRVDEVAGWLASARLGIGHSFGGWLLLCATAELLERGHDPPPLLLLSSVLGPGSLGKGTGVFSLPPRQAAVNRILDPPPGSDTAFPPDGLELVHAVDDDQCPVGLARRLADRHEVTVVPGGHHLDDEQAIAMLSRVLDRHRRRLESSCSLPDHRTDTLE